MTSIELALVLLLMSALGAVIAVGLVATWAAWILSRAALAAPQDKIEPRADGAAPLFPSTTPLSDAELVQAALLTAQEREQSTLGASAYGAALPTHPAVGTFRGSTKTRDFCRPCAWIRRQVRRVTHTA